MSNLNRKLLTIYLVLGIIFFVAVIYLFVKNEILPEINSEISHKVRLTSVRVIKNDLFNQKLLDSIGRNTNEESLVSYNPIREKEQSSFMLVNETDNATYAKSSTFLLFLFKSPFSIVFQDDSLIPLTTLNDKYRFDLEEHEKKIYSFEVPNLKNFLEINKKFDTVTEERTIKLTSADKKVILFLLFTID